MKGQAYRADVYQRQFETARVAEHPRHESIVYTLACAICRRRLNEALAALRQLPAVGRPA